MDNRIIIASLIVGLLAISFLIEAGNKLKLRKKVKSEWGRWPYLNNDNNEKSLKKAYEQLQAYNTKESYIDDLTWKDLDLFEVFKLINHTYSSVGSEGLYKRLRSFDLNGDDQKRIETLIQFYTDNPNKREKIQYTFAQLGKQTNNNAVKHLTEQSKKQFFHFGLYILLVLLPLIGLALFFLGYSEQGVSITVGSVLFNLVYSQMKKVGIGSELASMNYLVRTISTAKNLSKVDTPLKDEIKVNIKPLKRILTFSFAFRIGGNNEGEILFDYLNMLFMLPFISYHFVFNNLKKHEKEALKIWELLGEMESAGAILNYRLISELHCQPVFNTDDEVKAEESYHPLIEDPVVNPVSWHKNTLVSGSNASGKSTYVKSIALNCILAQTIYTCTASSFAMKRGHILTSMAVEDDVMKGDSYFIAEIKSLKRVLSKVMTGERCYCFIDEILKGTNTVERIAASASIIKWLTDSPSLAFVATHDIELTELLKDTCDNVHFQETVTPENGIEFDYQLRSGPSTTRNALELLSVMQFPESVVSEAKGNAAHFDETKNWLL